MYARCTINVPRSGNCDFNNLLPEQIPPKPRNTQKTIKCQSLLCLELELVMIFHGQLDGPRLDSCQQWRVAWVYPDVAERPSSDDALDRSSKDLLFSAYNAAVDACCHAYVPLSSLSPRGRPSCWSTPAGLPDQSVLFASIKPSSLSLPLRRCSPPC